MTKVKICGITNARDARQAVESGADALGFNFYPGSPRYVTASQAVELVADVPANVLRIGVFVNHEPDGIAKIAEILGLDAVQLHGDETPASVSQLRKLVHPQIEIMKALRVGEDFRFDASDDYKVDAFLLDSYSQNGFGGTGETFAWETARQFCESTSVPVYLAGGLSSENVAGAIDLVRPFAVDACSLLEEAPGVKNHTEVERFIRAVKDTK